MRNIWIISRRELNSYFSSPIAWILLTMYSILFGFFFCSLVSYFVQNNMEMQMMGQHSPVNINEQIIRPLLSNNAFLELLFVPLITMRLFAEEKRNGTIELLATSPVRDVEIIIGKWLAAVLLYSWLLLFTGLNFVFLFRYGHPDVKTMAVAYLGLILQGAALLSIGTFISTLTKNQIIAGVCTFGVCLLLWVFTWVTSYDSATWATVVSYLSVLSHSDSFSRGVLEIKDAVYYFSIIFLGLFLTTRSLESLRWRS
ncbi:MAG TPA: ABC transporter permease [Acidobacteriaceae bacterium]|jgi:ABC-2 type transport system permease protein|nr:ABC transporter permease [Acidobacteriaceae bacterium]